MTLKYKMLTAMSLDVLIDRINRYAEHHEVFDVQIIQDFITVPKSYKWYAVIKEDVIDK